MSLAAGGAGTRPVTATGQPDVTGGQPASAPCIELPDIERCSWGDLLSGDVIVDRSGDLWHVWRKGVQYVLRWREVEVRGTPPLADPVRRLIRGEVTVAIAAMNTAGLSAEVIE